MKLSLKPYQEQAVQGLRKRADQAKKEVLAGGDDQALILSAPTGSGKTAVATAFMERLVKGDEDYPPDKLATFLWLTDMPDLNEQTRRKLLDSSDVFADDSKLITIEAATFDQELFAPGIVYFLNTQKLAATSTLVRSHGDKRNFTLWQTIANTIAERPSSFWLIIDEAHRGMGRPVAEQREAQTIVQKFVVGSEADNVPAVPLIFGVSATPKRFHELIAAGNELGLTRVPRTVPVEAEDVRSSGLLKDSIVLYHSGGDQPGDVTMLKAAAHKLNEYEKEWASHSAKQKANAVRPVMVVQVEDAAGAKVAPTHFAAALKTVEDALGITSPSEVAHAFEEHTTLQLPDAMPVRYLGPADIERDPHVRVVFFKRSLTTGWDCPRAEVMMSFRKAKDETLIAQLVGRMVRTPLAESVSGNEFLNSVALYLPEYDKETVQSVIAKLSNPDAAIGLAGTDTKDGSNLVFLKRSTKAREIFKAATGLPMYRVELVPKISGVRRLLKLGRALGNDSIDKLAGLAFEHALLAYLESERAKRAGLATYEQRLQDASTLVVSTTIIDLNLGVNAEGSAVSVVAEARNIDQAFAVAGRKLGGGLHKAYLKARHQEDSSLAVSLIKCEIFVLVQEDGVCEGLNALGNELADQGLEKYDVQWKALGEERRSVYRQLRQQGSAPKAEAWDPPDSIEGLKLGKEWEHHIYIKEDGKFSFDGFNELEKLVLKEEMARPDFVGFFRNLDRKKWSFSINYTRGGKASNMYPDFLIFRKKDGKIVCDVLEPHSSSQSDSSAKARGLAIFAEQHMDSFGRVELIDKIDGKLKRLELHKPKVCAKVKGVGSDDHLKELFADP